MNENRCRVTVMPSEMPRRSSASAMSSADRVAVPRSMTFDSRYIDPGASAGSQTDPARMAMLIVTAGVVCVRRASSTAPFGRTTRIGARAVVFNSGDRQGFERADRAVRRGENFPRDRGDFLERHRRDPRAEVREDVHAGDRLEVADLMRDVRHAVVLEDQPRVEL